VWKSAWPAVQAPPVECSLVHRARSDAMAGQLIVAVFRSLSDAEDAAVDLRKREGDARTSRFIAA